MPVYTPCAFVHDCKSCTALVKQCTYCFFKNRIHVYPIDCNDHLALQFSILESLLIAMTRKRAKVGRIAESSHGSKAQFWTLTAELRPSQSGPCNSPTIILIHLAGFLDWIFFSMTLKGASPINIKQIIISIMRFLLRYVLEQCIHIAVTWPPLQIMQKWRRCVTKCILPIFYFAPVWIHKTWLLCTYLNCGSYLPQLFLPLIRVENKLNWVTWKFCKDSNMPHASLTWTIRWSTWGAMKSNGGPRIFIRGVRD